jgi:hypothetical protein
MILFMGLEAAAEVVAPAVAVAASLIVIRAAAHPLRLELLSEVVKISISDFPHYFLIGCEAK